MNLDLYNKFVEYHNEVMRRLTNWEKRASAIVQQRAPIVVDNLIARGLVEPDNKEEMINSLQDHAKCLQFIDNLAENSRPKLGTGVKKAVYGVGNERESDRIFKELVYTKL